MKNMKKVHQPDSVMHRTDVTLLTSPLRLSGIFKIPIHSSTSYSCLSIDTIGSKK